MNLRNIPAIDEILALPRIEDLLKLYNRDFIMRILRQAVEESRQELRLTGGDYSKENLTEKIMDRLEILLEKASQGTLQKVINGTGVVLHTNLGRAPLSNRALGYLNDMGRNYNNLEINLESGERGSRYRHVEELLITLTGAEAGLVVNNNAAAVLLGLTSLARNKEVIVSRGQLIEIGGAFRIPEVMKESGARLVEVGTTNKTYLSDYAEAITENTALLFSAHTSNYKIVGFTEEVMLGELVKLGQERKIPVMHDLGSGILTDLREWGLKDEPTVRESVESGADIISFSGDKLLGGPQAGIIVGQKKYIAAMKKNQLTRALRVDKLIIAALEGTLLEYLSGNPLENIPVLKMLTISPEELQEQAEKLRAEICSKQGTMREIEAISVIKTEDMIGGGAYPTHKIPGYGVQIAFKNNQLEKLSKQLRGMNPALLIRKQEDKMLISVRTLLEGDARILVELIEMGLLRAGEEQGPGGKL
ncbi:MAG: L-seryl-tRNA(Sec) selenium transferase [Firmicutes bacterium HGW-Firmicutes-15]|nr:MAG: L-seryl-tRNA(Sec) selenium transferase [Firmicutes bacterium HGW-Firmicutes-15]